MPGEGAGRQRKSLILGGEALIPPGLPWADVFFGSYLLPDAWLPDKATIGSVIGFVAAIMFIAGSRLVGKTGLAIGTIAAAAACIGLIYACSVVFPIWVQAPSNVQELALIPILWQGAYFATWVTSAGVWVWGTALVVGIIDP